MLPIDWQLRAKRRQDWVTTSQCGNVLLGKEKIVGGVSQPAIVEQSHVGSVGFSIGVNKPEVSEFSSLTCGVNK